MNFASTGHSDLILLAQQMPCLPVATLALAVDIWYQPSDKCTLTISLGGDKKIPNEFSARAARFEAVRMVSREI
jgi:hypothetical protein